MLGGQSVVSVAEELKAAKRAKLVQSAQAKVARGESPNKAELGAIAAVEKEQKINAAKVVLRNFPKSIFFEATGGLSKTFCEWKQDRGLPWQEGDYCNLADVLKWLFEAAKGKTETNRAAELKLLMLELDYEERKQRLLERQEKFVDAEELIRDRVGPCIDELRAGVEMLDRWPAAQQVLMGQIESGVQRLNGYGKHIGDRQDRAGAGGSSKAKASTRAPRVRKTIRKDAKGRAKGG